MILVVLDNQNTKNKVTKICNEPGINLLNEDRAQHRFKNEWTLVTLFLINHALLLSARSKSRGEAWRCVVKNVMPQLFLSTGFSNPFSM